MDPPNSPASFDAEFQPITPLTLRLRDACRLVGIGRSKLYELIAAEEIDTVKVGSITLDNFWSDAALAELPMSVIGATAGVTGKC